MESESIKILHECIDLQIKKSNDYQNPNSRIKQSDYYPRGLQTITDICWAKMLRIYSVLEAMDNDNNYNPNFESIEDSFKDLINYSSFAIAWIRGKINGQNKNDNDDYILISSFEKNELSIVLNYLIDNNYQFKILNNNNVYVTSLEIEEYKKLCQNLIILLNKC